VKNNFQFCAEDPGIVLEGTRDAALNRINHSYVVFEINKCHNEIR